jgi:hypothetical protein
MNGSSKSVVSARRPTVAARQNGAAEGPGEPRDWVQTMRASEEQTKIVIARAEAALERAANQLEEAHRRTAAAEELWRASEARAQRAEAQLRVFRPLPSARMFVLKRRNAGLSASTRSSMSFFNPPSCQTGARDDPGSSFSSLRRRDRKEVARGCAD